MDTAEPAGRKTTKSTLFTEGLLIAAAPVAAYLLALTYISGYASYFSIPMEFLSLNVTTMFVVGGKILSLALLVWLFVLLVFQFLPAGDNPLLRRILAILPWAALLYIQVMFFGRRWHEWRSTLLFFLLIAAELFLLPLIHRDKTSYMEKLHESDKRFHGASPTLAHRLFTTDRTRRIFTFGIWTWFSLTAAQSAGRFEAMWKTEFLVPSSAPGSVVLCTSGDYLILSPFDNKTKT